MVKNFITNYLSFKKHKFLNELTISNTEIQNFSKETFDVFFKKSIIFEYFEEQYGQFIVKILKLCLLVIVVLLIYMKKLYGDISNEANHVNWILGILL